jgi:hypothetical protein
MVIKIDMTHPFCVRCHINIHLDVKQIVRKFFLTLWLAPLHIMIENEFDFHKINDNFFVHHEIGDKKNLVATRLAVENFQSLILW